jgi:DNA polymerase-4
VRSVVHWDGDRFFASIEQAADRRLRNRPVVVGGARRGIVASASGEARRLGIRPGMPVRRARRICPVLTVIPGHFDLYEQFFEQILGLCEQTTPLVEPVTVGAAYLDLTGTRALHGEDAGPIVARLRETVRRWLRISFSAGIAGNKTAARIAARLRKPAGQVEVPHGKEGVFLAPLPIGWLDGLGAEGIETLKLAGVCTLGALARAPLDALELALGKRALRWQRRAQGVDEEPVRSRSAGAPRWREAVEFPEEAWEESAILASLKKRLETLLARARSERVEARKLTLTLVYTDRDESRHTLTLAHPTDLECDFESSLPSLLRSAWRRRVRLRAFSLTLGGLYQPSLQLSLFPEPKRESGALRRLAVAIDDLRKKYGEKAIRRGFAESPSA